MTVATACINLWDMATRAERNNRPGRESLSKRLGVRVVRAIHARDASRCVYCTQTAEESGAPLQFDHLTAQSEGGKDEATNLVLACRRCNRAKSNMTLAEWTRYAAAKLALTLDARAIHAHACTVKLAA